MANSALVDYAKPSPNNGGPRTRAIDRITPHCVVGQLSVEAIGGMFAHSSKRASCNYAIGSDGRVLLCVDEGRRSWCSSSADNDQRAVTIECASDREPPYAFNDAVYRKLVELCADVCRRNGKTRLLWLGGKEASLAYDPKPDEMVLTVHRWFANKSCPGDWMMERMGDLAGRVTAALGGSAQAAQVGLYRVRASWADAASQKGAFASLENARKCADGSPGYSVFDEGGNRVYPAAAQPAGFAPYRARVTAGALNIRKSPTTDSPVTGSIKDKGTYTIVEESAGKGASKWGRLKSGAGWISLDYTERA